MRFYNSAFWKPHRGYLCEQVDTLKIILSDKGGGANLLLELVPEIRVSYFYKSLDAVTHSFEVDICKAVF